jgi:hypothetical protein
MIPNLTLAGRDGIYLSMGTHRGHSLGALTCGKGCVLGQKKPVIKKSTGFSFLPKQELVAVVVDVFQPGLSQPALALTALTTTRFAGFFVAPLGLEAPEQPVFLNLPF